MAAIEEGDENEGISGMINELKEEIAELKDLISNSSISDSESE